MDDVVNYFESDLFRSLLAFSVDRYPALQKQFDEIYRRDKLRFFKAAQDCDRYRYWLSAKGTLESEVHFKRNLGIFVSAEADDELYREIRAILYEAHPNLKAYVSNPCKSNAFETEAMNKFTSAGNSRCLWNLAPIMIGAFLIYKENMQHIFECRVGQAAYIYLKTHSTMESKVQVDMNRSDESSLGELLEQFEFTRSNWRYIRNFKRAESVSVINGYCDWCEMSEVGLPEDFDVLSAFCFDPPFDMLDEDEINEVIANVRMLSEAMLSAGVAWDYLTKDFALSKAEQESVLYACLAAKDLLGECQPHHYVSAYMMYALAGQLEKSKRFYWENNDETQFYETEKLRQENERLRSELETKNTLILSYEREVSALKKEKAQEGKNLTKGIETPLREEIASLRKCIRHQEEQLRLNKRVEEELESLRNLVFSGNEDASQPEQIPKEQLKKLLAGKNVILVGGHQNWRAKIRQEYPELTVWDGIAPSADLRALDNADAVVFYTHNMSHKVYERIIAYARQHEILTAYLPKAMNLDLFTFELYRSINMLEK